MGYMKRMMEDICYFWRDGLTMDEIAKLCKTTIDDVSYTIDTYYDLILNGEP